MATILKFPESKIGRVVEAKTYSTHSKKDGIVTTPPGYDYMGWVDGKLVAQAPPLPPLVFDFETEKWKPET